jgi:hypothetical protein
MPQDGEVQEDPITKAEKEFYKIIKEVSSYQLGPITLHTATRYTTVYIPGSKRKLTT